MAQVWSEEGMYLNWLKIELAVCEAYAEIGKIPLSSFERIKEKASFNAGRIAELEKILQHDMLAFLTNMSEIIDNDNSSSDSRYIHLGLSSSDVKDTALSMTIQEAGSLLISGLDDLLLTLKNLALKHKFTACIGRTHGIHAEPITFGLKILGFYEEILRSQRLLKHVLEELRVGMFSGAVGTYSNFDPIIEQIACRKLNLKPALVTTQIIGRDRHANYLNVLATIASSIERLSVEIRHLQRTEILEVEEPFDKGQKGSSAMPHKRNPSRSENLSGLARMIRSYAGVGLENIVLWHERDISHSSSERIVLPDASLLLDFMIYRVKAILDGLNVYPENMKANLNKFGGVVFSQSVLIKLIQKGLKRETAYDLVQQAAMEAWNKPEGNFRKILAESEEMKKYLDEEELEACFSPDIHLRNISYIFKQILGDDNNRIIDKSKEPLII